MRTEHENKLAEEIRDVYCQTLKMEHTNAVHLAQADGLLAADLLGLAFSMNVGQKQ